MIVNLSSKRIKSIDEYYHHQYQQYLNHTETKALDLSNNDLVNNDGLKDFKNLYFLDLSFNRICLLLPFGSSIVRLNLSHNHIGAAFEEYKKMYCQGNKKLQSCFNSLVNLQYIDLSYNEIISLHSSLFENNKKLSSIILNHNNIKGPLYLFTGLNLQLLDLGHNNLLIDNVEKLECIKIKALILQFNPLEQQSNYEQKLRLSLKCVGQIQLACQLLILDQQQDMKVQRNSSIKSQSASSIKRCKENKDPRAVKQSKVEDQILSTPPRKLPRPNQIKENKFHNNSDSKQKRALNSSAKKQSTIVKRTMSNPKFNLHDTQQKAQVGLLEQFNTNRSQQQQVENEPLVAPINLEYSNEEIDSMIFKVNIEENDVDHQHQEDIKQESQKLDVLNKQYDDCDNKIKEKFTELVKIENQLQAEQRFINILKTIIIQRYQGGQCTKEFERQLEEIEQRLKDRNPDYKELHQRLLPNLFVQFNQNEIKTII